MEEFHVDRERIKKAVIEILLAIGEDPKRSGLEETPDRVARMYEDIFGGDKEDVADILGKAHELEHDEMVIVKDIHFHTMCEHHMLPFFGVCHIAYIPDNKRIVGISKLARIVDIFSKRLQVQEHFTTEIADAIMKHVRPKGVAVVVKARHMCMEMRGVRKPGASTITSVVRGIFRSDIRTREEFLRLID
jgi:GTP cyclohydrolase I